MTTRVKGLLSCTAATALAFSLAYALRLAAQQTTPKFEVASVRPNKSGVAKYNIEPKGGRFAANNVSLFVLIQWAYEMEDFRVSGGPAWIKSDRFDMAAESEGIPSIAQLRLMLQPLLSDRFHLQVHRQTKEMPVYELSVTRGGSKLKEGKCVGTPSPANPCGATTGSSRGILIGRVASVAVLAQALSGILSRPVLDRTRLAGEYDFDLRWTPDETFRQGPGDGDAQTVDDTAGSIFTAVQEQLGLTLRSVRGSVDVLVIEHDDHPAEN